MCKNFSNKGNVLCNSILFINVIYICFKILYVYFFFFCRYVNLLDLIGLLCYCYPTGKKILSFKMEKALTYFCKILFKLCIRIHRLPCQLKNDSEKCLQKNLSKLKKKLKEKKIIYDKQNFIHFIIPL